MKNLHYVCAAAFLLSAAPLLAASHEASFLKAAMRGDNSEMKLGAIAARRGASSDVRQFGQMLSSDHRKGKAEAAALARRLHVPVTSAMAPEAVAEQSKLAGLKGRAFDREFARYMVEDHRKDIAKFKSEAASGDRAAVTALARKTLPVLRKHLATAQSLQT